MTAINSSTYLAADIDDARPHAQVLIAAAVNAPTAAPETIDQVRRLSGVYVELAAEIIATVEPGPRRTIALRKLEESAMYTNKALFNPGS